MRQTGYRKISGFYIIRKYCYNNNGTKEDIFMEGKNVIAVTNRKLCKRPFLEVIEDLAKKDLKTIVLREKDLSPEKYEDLAKQCLKICEKYGASLTLHNFISVARKLGVKRIHLPYPMFLKEAGDLSDFESVSTSIHKPEEAEQAQKAGADFVFAGHIFATDCKKGLKPRGLEFLKKTVEAVDIPVYGIGGIKEENFEEILKTGAYGGCIMSGFMN